MLTYAPHFPSHILYSRQQVQELSGIPDDVLGFWLKSGLLVPEPAEGRKHRRFAFDQINIAVVLNAMRGLGANIGVLRTFAAILQRGAQVARRGNGLDHKQLWCAIRLGKALARFDRGEPVTVESEEWYRLAKSGRIGHKDMPDAIVATNRQQVIEDWIFNCENDCDAHGALPYALGLDGNEVTALDYYYELLMPEFVGDRLPNMNWAWVAWINGEGEAQIASGEDGQFNIGGGMPLAAFYLSVSKLIRRVWVPAEGRQALTAGEAA